MPPRICGHASPARDAPPSIATPAMRRAKTRSAREIGHRDTASARRTSAIPAPTEQVLDLSRMHPDGVRACA
jgi:hypothetical protein